MFVAGLDEPRPPVLDGQTENSAGPTTPRKPTSDPFYLLTMRLREALVSQRKPTIWSPETVRKSKTFQVLLVDKGIQFPPRKILPSSDMTISQQAHSPLSPLTPSSPLYPDGLMAPIWVRKHTSLVPSVFVLFLHLYEYAGPMTTPRSPLEPDGPETLKEREEREKQERRRDAELAREIAERKKSTNERGIKLTVVLMASRRMLDDPTLDSRLTHIRRSSGLDSRAALFVLSPVSLVELTDFVRSLQQALYDPALEYYTAHSKRVRRKRNRHAQTSSAAIYSHSMGLGGNSPGRPLPLRSEGWTVRYEYKMACFAEFRGEDEVALKHYQDAYSMLMIMFGSPSILPPRTKRWAEAKVLADTIIIKICKLYLYNSEHALALSQHNSHLRRFSDLSSRVWDIGEETFEYWSWLARQYRVFAELVEQGTQSSLTIPTYLPVPPTTATTGGQSYQELDTLRALGINPSTALMHPGFYYYIAAVCTERRRERFLEALEGEESQQTSSLAPGFQNEKKFDHLASILQLYTKSYELFKKYLPLPGEVANQSQGRFTLWIAYRIAQTYYASGKFDMADKFFERIAKSYRREQWDHMLITLLSAWYKCAQQLGNVELSVKLLVEMLAEKNDQGNQDEEYQAPEDLLAILKSTVPSTTDAPIVVDLIDRVPLLNSSVLFWVPEIHVGERVAFQISLSVPESKSLWSLPIVSLRIDLMDGGTPIIIKQERSSDNGASVLSRVDVGHLHYRGLEIPQKEVEGNIRLQANEMLVISGTLSSDIPRELKFTTATLTMKDGSWDIEVPFTIGRSADSSSFCPRWLASVDPNRFIPIRRSNPFTSVVKHRPHDLHVDVSHRSPAMLDEQYPITVNVTNNDDRELSVTIDVLIQPGDDDSVNYIILDGVKSNSLIKGISLGVLHSGTTACKTLYLVSTGATGLRVLDISIQSRADGEESNILSQAAMPLESNEILQTLSIPSIAPLTTTHEVTYKRRESLSVGPASLVRFDADYWDDCQGGQGQIITTFECVDCPGATNILITGIKLLPEVNSWSNITHCSLDGEQFPLELYPGDQMSVICGVSLALPDDYYADQDSSLVKPGGYSLQWRRSSLDSRSTIATTYVELPQLQPPANGLVALLNVSPIAYLHKPFLLELIIRNLHPTRTACPSVSLELDQSDNFVVAGIRSGRLPMLIPGAEEKIVWNVIPLECGSSVLLPRIKVVDMRKVIEATESGGPAADVNLLGEDIPIFDTRRDKRSSNDLTTFPGHRGSELFGNDNMPGVQGNRFAIIVSSSR